MDLRIVKTKQAIKDAFLKLRKEQSLEKIKIKDLCQLALINKTTFYKHYKDIFDLSDQLENEALAAVIDAFVDRDQILTNPKAFMEGIPLAFKAQDETLSIIFDKRLETMTNKFEKLLRLSYQSQEHDIDDDVQKAFIIGGCFHTFQVLTKECDYPLDQIRDRLVTILNCLKSLNTL